MSYTLSYTELIKSTKSAYLLAFDIDTENKFVFKTWLPSSNTKIDDKAKSLIINDWLFKKLAQKKLPGNNGTFYRHIEKFIIDKNDLTYTKDLDDDSIRELIAF